MGKMTSPNLNQSLSNGEFVSSPAGHSLSQSLNLKNLTSNAKPLKLRRVNHTDEIVFGFSSLLRSESMTDVTLICNGGQTIKAHRVILSTFSPYFRAIFESQPFSNNPCQYPVIVIKDLELSELRTIIDFIYKGEVSVSRDKLQSVLQAAKALEVSGLADLKLESMNGPQTGSNGVNTLLGNSLMNSPNLVNNNSSNNSDLADQLNFGSLSALNYVCNLNGNNNNSINGNAQNSKRAANGGSGSGTNSLNNSLDNNDLFSDSQLKKLRVSIDDSNELLNSLGTSLLGDNTVNIEGVRSLLQQPPRIPQALQQQLKQQAQMNQFQQQINKQRQVHQMYQQRQQQLQRMQAHQQSQQRLEQLRQIQQLKNKFSVPKGNTLQGQQLAQFQEKIKQQIQEKQQHKSDSLLNDKASALDELSKTLTKQQQQQLQQAQDQDEPEIIDEIHGENSDKLNENGEQGELIVDDENNNEINKLDDEQEDDKKDDKNGDALDNGDSNYVDYDENGDSQALNPEDEEEYEIDINKDLVFQRQQQIRLEQLQKQAHFQQFDLMQVDDPDNRNLESNFQKLLQATAAMRNGNSNGELAELNNGSRRNSSKDSLIQTSSASGSEDTDNDNHNDNTLDINDNLSIMDNNFFDDYNNLTSGSPIPMQVKLDPQLSRIPQTPDFLLPRGPGRPRKGNKGSDISPCPECHKKFVRPDVLKLHYRSVHLLERHPCNMCKKVFKWPGDLSKHKRKSCRGNMELAINRQ